MSTSITTKQETSAVVDISAFLASDDAQMDIHCPTDVFHSHASTLTNVSVKSKPPVPEDKPSSKKRKTVAEKMVVEEQVPATDSVAQSSSSSCCSQSVSSSSTSSSSSIPTSSKVCSSPSSCSAPQDPASSDLTAPALSCPLSSNEGRMPCTPSPSVVVPAACATTALQQEDSTGALGLRRSTRKRSRPKQLLLSMERNDKDSKNVKYSLQEYDPRTQEQLWQKNFCGDEYERMVEEEAEQEDELLKYDEEFDEKAAEEAAQYEIEEETNDPDLEEDECKSDDEDDQEKNAEDEEEEDSEDEFIQNATRHCKKDEDPDSTDEDDDETDRETVNEEDEEYEDEENGGETDS